jgi:hypothetical protein
VNDVTWFVQSRGFHQDHGFRWVRVDDGPALGNPNALAAGYRGFSLNALAAEHERTLLLHARPGRRGAAPLWTLLANGFEGPRRPGVARHIRATVLAFARGPLPAALLDFAAAFLTGDLPERLPISYDRTEAPGFSVDPGAWAKLLAGLPGDSPTAPGRPVPEPADLGSRGSWLLPDSAANRRRAALLLRAVTAPGDPEAAAAYGLTGASARPLLLVSTTVDEATAGRLRPCVALSPSFTRERTTGGRKNLSGPGGPPGRWGWSARYLLGAALLAALVLALLRWLAR